MNSRDIRTLAVLSVVSLMGLMLVMWFRPDSVTADEASEDDQVAEQQVFTSIEISGLGSGLRKGSSDSFSVVATLAIGEHTINVSASGGVGFNSNCSDTSESASVDNDGTLTDNQYTMSLTLYGCSAGSGSVSASVGSASDSQSVTVTNKVPNLPSVGNKTGRFGKAFSTTLPAATGGDTPLVYWVTNVPLGLSFSSSSRKISGTPRLPGSYTVTYGVTDNDGDVDRETFTLTIAPDTTPKLPAVSDRTFISGRLVSFTLPAAVGGDAPLKYSVSGLPNALAFNSVSRVVQGRIWGSGDTTVTYSVSDKDGDSDSKTFTITVDSRPCLSSIADKTARLGLSYSTTLPASQCGDRPITYSASGLPSGLSFTSSSRVIDGKPDTLGSSTVTYTASDNDGDTDSKSFKITVIGEPDVEPVAPTVSNKVGTVGVGVSITLPAGTGGNGTLKYSVSDLPDGLSFDGGTRKITGSPTKVQTKTVTYTVKDADEDEDSTTFKYTIHAVPPPPPPELADIADKSGREGVAFSSTLPAATGGRSPYTYTVSGLPSGLSFDSTKREIKGRPSEYGTFSVTYTVTDANGLQDTSSFDLVIAKRTDLEPTCPSIGAKTGRAWISGRWSTPAATGGDGTLKYELSGMPTGVSSSGRSMSGAPRGAQSVTVTYKATDSDATDPDSCTTTFKFTVTDPKPSLSSVSTKYGTEGVAGTWSLPAATGGNTPIKYVVNGRPSWLGFDSSDLDLSGTPPDGSEGTYSLTYVATDSDPEGADSVQVSFSLVIRPRGSTDKFPDLPATLSARHGKVDTPGSWTLPQASGGDPPLKYSLSGHPSELNFTGRTLSGTPRTSGTHKLRYTVTDSDTVGPDSDYVDFDLVIAPDRVPTCPTLGGQSGRVGVSGTWTIDAASGGDGTLKYVLSNLPGGLTAVGRVISGRPTTVEEKTVGYRATDSDTVRPDSCDTSFKFVISTGNTIPDLPGSVGPFSSTIGVAFSQVLPAATGGDAPLTYTVSGLPDGLTFDASTRRIGGAPSGDAQTATVTYGVSDTDGESDSVTFEIRVGLELAQPGDMRFVLVQYSSVDLPEAKGGKGAYRYALGGEQLPTGLLFDSSSTGPRIYGTATQEVEREVKYKVTDGAGSEVERTFDVNATRPASGRLTVGSSTVNVGETFTVTASWSPSGLAARIRYSSGLVVGGSSCPASSPSGGTPKEHDLTGSSAEFKVCLPRDGKVELLVTEGGADKVLASLTLTVRTPAVNFVGLAESLVMGRADNFRVQVLNVDGDETYDIRVWASEGSGIQRLGFDEPVENADGTFTCSGLSRSAAGLGGDYLASPAHEMTVYGCVPPGGTLDASVSYEGNVVGGATAQLVRVSAGPPTQKPSGLALANMVGFRGIEATWNSDVPDATSYLVSVTPGDSDVSISTSVGKAEITGLKVGELYTVEVRGVNDAGPGVAASEQGRGPEPTYAVGHLPGHVAKFDYSGVSHDGLKEWVVKAAKLWNGRTGSNWKMCDGVEIPCPANRAHTSFAVKTVAPSSPVDIKSGCKRTFACAKLHPPAMSTLAESHLTGTEVVFESPAYDCSDSTPGLVVCPESKVTEYVYTAVASQHNHPVGQGDKVYFSIAYVTLHEMGHMMGLPDFYRTSGARNYSGSRLHRLDAVMNTYSYWYSASLADTVRDEDLAQLRAMYARHEPHE